MKMRIASLSLLTVLCLALSVPALADLYNNGPTNGTVNSYFIDAFVVTDSFVPNANTRIFSFTFAEWVPPGSTPLTVDWAIGTSSFGSNLGSGFNAPIFASLLCHSGDPFNGGICGFSLDDVYTSSVIVGAIPVTAGQTYWLTLANAKDDFGGRDSWDENSGPSTAYENTVGSIPSEAFTLTGFREGTPEPSSILLFGSGIIGLAGMLRRKLNI